MAFITFIAIGLELYQVAAHAHCLFGRILPRSHRSSRGFAIAIACDILSYVLTCVCLFASGRVWTLFLVPLLAHLIYECWFLFFPTFYSRIHDYRLPTIYSDRSMYRPKQLAALLDTSFHLLAVVLLLRHAPGVTALALALVGIVAYWFVFLARHATKVSFTS